MTGTTKNSRLIELRKYTITEVFENKYPSTVAIDVNGVDYRYSVSGVRVTYYMDGIKYVDDVINGITTFTVNSLSYDPSNYVDVNYYKNPNSTNIINMSKVNNDVFIERQELSAFDSNYKLEFIKNLNDLKTYASGKFFHIINYT